MKKQEIKSTLELLQNDIKEGELVNFSLIETNGVALTIQERNRLIEIEVRRRKGNIVLLERNYSKVHFENLVSEELDYISGLIKEVI